MFPCDSEQFFNFKSSLNTKHRCELTGNLKYINIIVILKSTTPTMLGYKTASLTGEDSKTTMYICLQIAWNYCKRRLKCGMKQIQQKREGTEVAKKEPTLPYLDFIEVYFIMLVKHAEIHWQRYLIMNKFLPEKSKIFDRIK